MAKIIEGILGGFSGRVGTVVGYHRRGRWFVRAYQPHVRDRRSEAQLLQRSRFTAMIRFAAPATPMLRVGLREVADRWTMTEGNVFLRVNNGRFVGEGDGLGIAVDYAGLRFSRGTLPRPAGLAFRVDEAGVIEVRWKAEYTENKLLASLVGDTAAGGYDKVWAYAYCPAAGTGVCLAAHRSQGRLRALLPEGFAGQELHVWAFVQGRGGAVSGTVYVREDESDGTHSDAESGTLRPASREEVEAKEGTPAAGAPSCERIRGPGQLASATRRTEYP